MRTVVWLRRKGKRRRGGRGKQQKSERGMGKGEGEWLLAAAKWGGRGREILIPEGRLNGAAMMILV